MFMANVLTIVVLLWPLIFYLFEGMMWVYLRTTSISVSELHLPCCTQEKNHTVPEIELWSPACKICAPIHWSIFLDSSFICLYWGDISVKTGGTWDFCLCTWLTPSNAQGTVCGTRDWTWRSAAYKATKCHTKGSLLMGILYMGCSELNPGQLCDGWDVQIKTQVSFM